MLRTPKSVQIPALRAELAALQAEAMPLYEAFMAEHKVNPSAAMPAEFSAVCDRLDSLKAQIRHLQITCDRHEKAECRFCYPMGL